MTDLDHRYVQTVIDHFAPRVTEELDRVEAEMRARFPGCSIFTHVYNVAYHLKNAAFWQPERGKVVLAFVQCRTVAGAIHSATVWVGLGTEEVWVTGWPLDEQSGWVRG